MEEISLLELWQGIKKRILLIILVTLVFGATTFVVNKFFIKPTYQASATMLIGKSQDYDGQNQGLQYNDVVLSQKLVSTYSTIVKSRAIATQVINDLQLDLSISNFQNKVTVETVRDTEVISVLVTDTNPKLAQNIANKTTHVFQEYVQEIMYVDNVKILDEAILPGSPVSPRVLMNTALALILGLFLSSSLAVIIEITDTRIKSADEFQAKFDIPILGLIPNTKES